MILDYSQYVSEKGSKGIVNDKVINNNISIFKHDSTCPFCKEKIDNVIYHKHKIETPEWLYGSFEQWETVIQCPKCGWWEHKYLNASDAIIDGIRASDVEYDSAILKSYDDNSIEVPILSLREYITKKPDILYKIDAHKMEDLVRSVFSDFFPSCKVKKFGQTRDGGKDGLIIDENGKQFLISVKRREASNSTEGVGTLRDLIGATVISDNVSGCIVVSTADHFSKPAKDYAEKVVDKKIIETFDLVDCKEFLRLTDLTREKMPIVWENLVKL